MAPACLFALLLLLVGAPAAAAESVGAWGSLGGGPVLPLFLGAWDGGLRGPRLPQLDAEAGETLLETWLWGHGEVPGWGGSPARTCAPACCSSRLPWPRPRRALQART